MAYYFDIREYLEVLRKKSLLREIKEKINKDTELFPIVRWQYRGLHEDNRTGFLFHNVVDNQGRLYDCPVAVSIIGASTKVYALAMQCNHLEIGEKWEYALSNPLPPRLVATGPAQDEVHSGEKLLEHQGLEEFPHPISTPGFDPAPYITAGAWHTKDPDTGIQNVGNYRAMVKGLAKTGLSSRHSHIYAHLSKYKQLGKPMPAAIVIGAVPSVAIASVTKVPYGVDELAVAGAIGGEPLDVVRCKTVDLVVPATAEIVIEGEVCSDCEELEGPFGEYTGYMTGQDLKPVFKVTCITHRRNPIYHAFISEMPPSESSKIRGIGEEASLLKFLRRDCGLHNVRDVACYEASGAWNLCVIQLHKDWVPMPTHSEVWQVLMGSMAKSGGHPKIAIVVDDDIDPRDFESVIWAVSFRYQPHLDTKIVEGRFGALDPSYAPPEAPLSERFFPMGATGPRGGSAILIDATMKWPYPPVALPKREFMEGARERWESLGLPKLTPRMPWYGYESK